MVKNFYVDRVGVYIGRPSAFGNPFVMTTEQSRFNVIRLYQEWIWKPEQLELRNRMRRELKGTDLVCYCAPKPCHGDVIEKEILTTPMEIQEEDFDPDNRGSYGVGSGDFDD